MRIAVVIPSRGNAQRLQGVIHALHGTASRMHTIFYVVSYCREDPETRKAVLALPAAAAVKAHMRTDHCTPGQAFNEAAAVVDADVYMGWCDDVFPLTWCWDTYVAAAAEQLPAAYWIEAADPQNTSYGFATAKVLAALGKLQPEYFPFWFVDIWFAEVNHFAFGRRPPLISNLILGGQRGKTQGHRETLFWAQFFAYTRPERMALGGRLAAAYDLLPPDPRQALEACSYWDADFQSKCANHDARFNEDRAPEPYYEIAKAKALAMLAEKAA